jgi:hypothetical protein
MNLQYTCPLLHNCHVSVYLSLKSGAVCLTVWITNARCTTFNVAHSSGCAGIETMPITVVLQCSTGYIYSSLLIQHFPSFSSRVYSLLLHLSAMEEKRGIKRSRSSTSDSSSSLSRSSTPPPSPSVLMSPPVLPPEASPCWPPPPVREHSEAPKAMSVVDLSSNEEEIFPDITQDEEFA